jgi:hypothetical protein
MKNHSENTPLSPLHVGDTALRFRVEWRLVGCGDGTHMLRPFVLGVRSVRVVMVSEDGQRVTWTEGAKKRGGGEYRHTCERRELLSLDAVANELCASTPPEKMAGRRELNPAAAA